jgi:ADP-ribosyl-[dinitrogen reductase] hydrolase
MNRITEADPILDRFLGTVLGSAVGDAMGGPLEFQPPSPPDALITDMIGGGWQQLDPGEWTDDTQMTICVIESILTKRVFDPDDIADRFVSWMRSQPKDIGVHTSRVLHAIENGTPWEIATRDAYMDNPSNAPNGSLMRCSPLSLYFFRHSEFLTELSPVLSRITHAHPDCEWACVFLNVLITELVGGERVINAIETAYNAVDGASNELKDRIGSAMRAECSAESTGYVLDTLEVALWVFLHTESFEQAIVTAINKGGDADTVGAITGALAGARYGALAVPAKWLNTLNQVDRLCKYADGLYELAMA